MAVSVLRRGSNSWRSSRGTERAYYAPEAQLPRRSRGRLPPEAAERTPRRRGILRPPVDQPVERLGMPGNGQRLARHTESAHRASGLAALPGVRPRLARGSCVAPSLDARLAG